jgi:nucleoside-diphosphate-sugar epimerase
MRVLIVGCGYTGLPLGARLAREGHEVTGIRRSRGSERELLQSGIQPILVDITSENTFARLPVVYDWVVNCVSSSKGDTEDYRATYLEGMQRLIEWLKQRPPNKFVYTSSTSVYAQTDGSLVTEDSPTEPMAETGRILVETEKVALKAVRLQQVPAVILRLAGIYGPNRGYWFRQYMSGKAEIENDGKRVLNMIHRDDVVGAIIAALKEAPAGEIYNVADDQPVTQIEFFSWLSEKLGRSLPPVAAQAPSKERKRGLTNKRVSNLKLKNGLGYKFEYPTFREGYEEEIRSAVSK